MKVHLAILCLLLVLGASAQTPVVNDSIAKKLGCSGIIMVEFIANEDNSITNVKAVKAKVCNVDYLYDAAGNVLKPVTEVTSTGCLQCVQVLTSAAVNAIVAMKYMGEPQIPTRYSTKVIYTLPVQFLPK